MEKSDNKKTYINMLIDILVKKKTIMEKLLERTLYQKILLEDADLKMDDFEAVLPVKDELIKSLTDADHGFDDIYAKVEAELHINKNQYKQEITTLQQLIKDITDKSVKLQALEQNNRDRLELYLTQKKLEFKNFKISNKTANSYYKNMSGSNSGESYFMDKRK